MTVHRIKFLFNKTNRQTEFQIYFDYTTLHANDQELSTVQLATAHFMLKCHK